MQRLFWHIVAATLGLWLAIEFVHFLPGVMQPGMVFTGSITTLILIGAVLGIINFLIKPILKLVTLPLNVLTLGLVGLIINMFTIWVVDVLFVDLNIIGLAALFWTTVIIWLVSFFFGVYNRKRVEQVLEG